MDLLPVKLPEFNKPVIAVIKSSHSWTFNIEVKMVCVDEDDCTWRFFDDDSELSYDWDVIYWEYVNT